MAWSELDLDDPDPEVSHDMSHTFPSQMILPNPTLPHGVMTSPRVAVVDGTNGS